MQAPHHLAHTHTLYTHCTQSHNTHICEAPESTAKTIHSKLNTIRYDDTHRTRNTQSVLFPIATTTTMPSGSALQSDTMAANATVNNGSAAVAHQSDGGAAAAAAAASNGGSNPAVQRQVSHTQT